MASVYEVEHMELGVHYALKAFTFDADHADLFKHLRYANLPGVRAMTPV